MYRQELCGKHLVALSGVLTEQECARLIAQSEQHGYTEEPGRSGARCVLADPGLAALLWSRLGPALDAAQGGLAPRLVFQRFNAGQRLLPGPAGLGDPDADPQAHTSVHLYLNEGYEGGETVCYPHQGPIHLQPCRGLALVLSAALSCEELPVLSGRKYLLRLEVEGAARITD
jgi:hypothetical protein